MGSRRKHGAVIVSVLMLLASLPLPTEAASVQVRWEQCHNDTDRDGFSDTPMCEWGNGSLNPNNAILTEGNSPPPYPPFAPGHVSYRAIFEGLIAGTYELTIRYDFTKGGKVAFDFLTTNYGVTDANLCDSTLPGGVSPATCSALPLSTATLPFDTESLGAPRLDATIEERQRVHDAAFASLTPRTMKIYGATITGITNLARDGLDSGNSEDKVKITLVKTAPEASPVIATWGGHLAIGSTTVFSLASCPVGGCHEGYGTGNGASSISGSPFHMILDVLARISTPADPNVLSGSRDRGVKSGTVVPQTFFGRVVIDKDAVPDDPQDFEFSRSFGPNFFLDDDPTDATLSNTITFPGLPPGSYTVAELVPSGWDLSDLLCADPDGGSSRSGTTALIDLDSGETVTCTFTDRKRGGSITIVKDSIPDDPEDFMFTSTSSTPDTIGSFILDDDPASATPRSRTFSNLASGQYSVTERVPLGWKLSRIVCLDPSRDTIVNLSMATVTINLAPGESVTCTFTNVKPGVIEIVKDAVPNDPQDFEFTRSFGSNFFLDDDPADATLPKSIIFSNLDPGSHTVTELVPPGWRLQDLVCIDPTLDTLVDLGAARAFIELSPNETVTCTFTNTKRGTITVVKDAVPDDPQDFTFCPSWTSCFLLDDDPNSPETPNSITFSNLSPGTYTVTESVPSEWELVSIVCTDPDGGSSASGTSAIIDLDSGEAITCTFTNSRVVTRGVIEIVKDAVPNDPQDFEFTRSFGSNFFLDDDPTDATLPNRATFADLRPGEYEVAELRPTGWRLESLKCADPSADTTIDLGGAKARINLGPGETVTCTFTNTNRGSITIVKDAVPDDPQDFTFCPSWTSCIVLDDDPSSPGTPKSITFLNLAPGSYEVTEFLPAGWDLSSLGCVDPDSGSSNIGTTALIDLDSGETITCTFTNVRVATP